MQLEAPLEQSGDEQHEFVNSTAPQVMKLDGVLAVTAAVIVGVNEAPHDRLTYSTNNLVAASTRATTPWSNDLSSRSNRG